MTYRNLPLGELVSLQAGYGFPLELQGRTSGDYPFAKVGDISRTGRSTNPVITHADHFVDSADLKRLRAKLIPAGSVLFAKIGEAIRQNHRVLAGCDLLIDNNAMAAIPSEKIDGRFLYHYLKTVDFYRLAPTTTVPALRKSDLESLSIPYPSLPEQRRIAAILDQADAVRAKRREALAQLDSLTQSIFIEMFGDLMSKTGQWETVPVSKFVSGFESGKSVAAEDEEDASSIYRVLKVSAVTSLDFNSNESKAAPPHHIPQSSHFVRPGDLLFSRANTTELVGATAYVFETPDNLLLPDKLWRFVWYEQPLANPHFVNYLFRQRQFRAEIGRRASGSSGSMKNISQEKVLSIEVALPPLALQQRFADHVEKIMRMKVEQISATKLSDQLFASLQHRAFRGEL